MEIEGIVLYTLPFKERDLIYKILTRQGEVANLFLYGGQGGGKSQKPKMIQPGHLIRCHLQDRRTGIEHGELYISSQIEVRWESHTIRHNIDAFFLQSFFVEIILKIAPTFHRDYRSVSEQQGLFNVLSNSLFYIDEALASNQFVKERHLAFYLIKLLYHLGLSPNENTCVSCDGPLQRATLLQIKEGGFVCHHCQIQENGEAQEILETFKIIYQTKFTDYLQTNISNRHVLKIISEYFFYHNQLNPLELKSKSLVI